MSYVERACYLVLFACCGVSASAQSLSDIEVASLRGQTGELARRDRYECHNWAVAQTGGVPAAGPTREEVVRERRAARTDRIIAGAGIGAAVGGILRGSRDHRDAADGAIAGGILGAAAGGLVKGRETEPDNEDFMAYFRALSACMNGRGYALSLAGAGGE